MGNYLVLKHNVEGREERAPFGVIIYLVNITGVIGNALVIHIFRTRLTSSSNYRIFVLLLAFIDLFLCIAHISKELNRMISVYNQVSGKVGFICEISHYVGHAIGHSSLYIVVFIGIERYRKICTPFKQQITMKHTKIMCIVVVITSFFTSFPIYLFHGRRFVLVENINATRCAVKNEFDGNLLQFIFYGFFFVESLGGLVTLGFLQISILKALAKKAKSKRNMKSMAKVNENEKKAKETTKDSAEQQEAEKNRSIARTFAFVTLFLVISFLTTTLYQSYKATSRFFWPKERISKVEDIIDEYLPDVITFSGILNPFVYFFTDNQFNQELKKLCGRKGN